MTGEHSDQMHVQDPDWIALCPSSDAEVQAANAHAQGCAECLQALRVARAKADALGLSSVATQSRSEREQDLDAELAALKQAAAAQTPWLQRAVAPAMVVAVFVGLGGLSLASAAPTHLWTQAAVVVLIASYMAFVAMRQNRRATVSALAVLLILCLVAQGESALHVRVGLRCVLTELMGALVACAAVLLVHRKYALRANPAVLGATALTASLGAAAVLHVLCPAHGGLLHNGVFHGGGVLLSWLAAWVISRVAAKTSPHLPVALMQ
jgi:hypothetical protein